MDVRSSFSYSPRNVKGAIQNGIARFDTVANAAQVITATENMNSLDMGNRSDNHVQATISLTDADGNTSTAHIYQFPGSSETWNFDGRFITAVSIIAVNEPTATAQNASGLVAAAVAQPGIVDVNLIEV